MKTNLQKIVQTLMDDGHSQDYIARQCDCSQPTISHIKNDVWGNSKPTYKMATGLLALAAKHGIRPNGTRMKKKKVSS